jgi:hypothetical protein
MREARERQRPCRRGAAALRARLCRSTRDRRIDAAGICEVERWIFRIARTFIARPSGELPKNITSRILLSVEILIELRP